VVVDDDGAALVRDVVKVDDLVIVEKLPVTLPEARHFLGPVL
jgi:hypothetical protein